MSAISARGLLPVISLVLAGTAMAATPTTAPDAGSKSPVAAHAAAPKAGAPQTEDEKTLYALGVLLSGNLDSFALSDAEFNQVRAGITDGFHHRANDADAVTYEPKLQALLRSRAVVVAQREKAAGEAYYAKAAAETGARKTASGLLYIPITEGTGAAPTRTDQVKVNYEGQLVDGTVFDSSIARGQPATLVVGNVIPCWSEALQLMKVGGKARVICPAELAYGDRGAAPKIKPGATLVFNVELLDVAAPAAPANTAPSATAPPSK